MVKRAFTLIELIFAIIVLSIAFLAIPELFVATSSNIEEILKDEATFQGVRTAGAIQTYPWDEKSQNSDGNFTYILDVQDGDDQLDRVAGTQYRVGNDQLGKKRKFYQTTTLASTTLGSDTGDTIDDDIDDFNNHSETITSLVVDLTVTTKVFYIDDDEDYSAATLSFDIPTTSQSQSSNIKMIEVKVKDSNNNHILTYRTISCNIGTAPIRTRTLK